MAQNDTRIRQSYITKQLGGYINIQNNNVETEITNINTFII